MAHYLITGGTGMIGTALTNALRAQQHAVTILGREIPAHKMEGVHYALWDPAKGTIDEQALHGIDVIFHLAGANVAGGRWTAKRKQEIVDSRVQSGNLLVSALSKGNHSVKCLVTASAIGWYGPDPQVPNHVPFTEDRPAYDDFLGNTCIAWEQATEGVEALGIRRVISRLGIVFSRNGGAYAEFRKPMEKGLATILGSGRQMVSWIHIDDLVRWFIHAAQNEKVEGIYNVVAQPVSNSELIKTMASIKKGWQLVTHAPAFAIRLMLGEMSVEVLKSATVSNTKMEGTGFALQYNGIDAAIRQLEAG